MSQSSRQQGGDPLADFQRWLLRASARGLGRDVRGNLRKTFGHTADEGGDVWASATSEPPPGEPPECEWCPLCRAARKFKDSGPGIGSHLSSAGDLVATVVQDAMDAFEAVITARPGPGTAAGGQAPAAGRQASGADGGTTGTAGTSGAGGETAGPGGETAGPGGGTPWAGGGAPRAGGGAPWAGGGPAGAGGGPAAERGQQGAAGERQERPPGGPDDRG